MRGALVASSHTPRGAGGTPVVGRWPSGRFRRRQRVDETPAHGADQRPGAERANRHGGVGREKQRKRDGERPADREVGEAQASSTDPLAPSARVRVVV